MSDAADTRELKVGGTVDARTDVYIERREDKELLELLDRGEYCNILASRQVGKSSLMTRTMTTLQARGRQVALIDVAGNLGTPEKADDWYCGLLGEIVRRVGHRMNVREWWARAEGTPNQRLIQFFREELLPRAEGGLVVMLDEIDHTLRFDYTDDLFTAIRSMYNERPGEPLFRRVAFCLAGVATPNELIKNQRTTAYNVGRTIELTDFDPADDDLSPLYRAMSVDGRDGEAIVKAILSWSGGHPYLTLRLCQEFLASGRTEAGDVDQFVAESYAALERLSGDTHFQQISRFVKERLTNDVAAFSLYERLLSGQRERDQPTLAHTQLKLAGLVKRDARGDLVVRNRIYERVFDLAWVHYSTPLRQAVEQQAQLRQATTAASRRGRIAMWAGSALAVLIAAGIGYTTLLRAPLATRVLTELESTADEQVAMANYGEIMDGGSAPTRWLWRMVYGGQATQAYSDFWQRRGASLDERALTRLKEGRVDEACMLGAAAAVKRNGPLLPEIQQAFDRERFAAVRWTDSDRPSGLGGLGVDGSVPSLTVYAGISPDGSRAVAFQQLAPQRLAKATIYETLSGRRLGVEEESTEDSACQITPDLTRRVEIAADGSTVVEPIGDGSQSGKVKFAGPAQEGSRAVIANNTHLAAVTGATSESSDDRIRVWELATAKLILDQSLQWPGLHSINIDSGSRVLSAASSSGIRLYWLDSGKHIDVEGDDIFTRRARALTRPFHVLFSPDGSRLLCAFEGRSVLWNTRTGQRERILASYATVFSGDSRYLAGSAYTLEGETVAQLWDLTTPADARIVGSDTPVALSHDGGLIAIARTSRLPIRIEVVDLRNRNTRRQVVDGARAALSPDGKSLAVTGPPPSLRVWDVDELLRVAPAAAVAPSVRVAPNSAATPALTPEERWTRWQIKFGLTVDKNDEVVPLWQTRHDGRSGPVAIAGRPATIG